MFVCSVSFQNVMRDRFFADNDPSQMIILNTASRNPISKDTKKPEGELKSILFMDDERTLRLVVPLMLERLGYEVTTAEHGRQALSLYQSRAESGKPFDAVIFDIYIESGMGGIETIGKLRKLYPDVKAIGASGSVAPEKLKSLLKIGFSAVLAKPFRLEQLKNALDQLLAVEAT